MNHIVDPNKKVLSPKQVKFLAETYFLEQWAKKEKSEICQCRKPDRHLWISASTLKCKGCNGFVKIFITRAMIKELVEEVDGDTRMKFGIELIKILNVKADVRFWWYSAEINKIAFSTTDDLLIAFLRAYGGA